MPSTGDALDQTLGGPSDGFVAVFDDTGANLSYATYLGGAGYDAAKAIAIDFSDGTYVTGYAGSTDFQTTDNAYNQSKDWV